MQAKETTLVHLLEGEKQYLVPLYQRTYSWGRDQLTQLWNDILGQADALQDGGSGPGHFLGSVVLAPAPGTAAGGVQRWIVVDGQQRLTTLLVGLAALRDHVRGENAQGAERVHKQNLVNEYQSGTDRFKLLPTQVDRTAFAAVVDDPRGLSGGNIAAAYRFFAEQLVGADDPEDPHDITRIEQAIRNRLDLVAITADADDNVHRIFESLNNTGMGLTQGDLLRNYLFMLLPTRGEHVYSTVWRPMQERIGAENIETLAYLDLQLRGHTDIHRSDTYRKQQERFRPIESDEDAIEAEIIELDRRAHHLKDILNPPSGPDGDITAALQRLTEWGPEATYPVLMVLLDRHERGLSDSGEVVTAALYLESYLVRRMLCGRSAAGLNRTLANVALQIVNAADAGAELREYLSQPRRYWPDDKQLAAGMAERNFYWSGKAPQRRFVMRRLEESYGHKEPIDWGKAQIQIEHIMPQTPTAEWLQSLAEEAEPGETATEVHQSVVQRLGNLTLTGYNPDLGNSPFPEKRSVFADSHFQMTKEVADEPTWGRRQIQERGEALAKRAVTIWPGPIHPQPAVSGNDKWRVVRQVLVALPEGSWTTYGDVAAVVGIHARPLGGFIANSRAQNAWRVLRGDGTVSPDFRWADPTRTEDPYDVLAAEGVRFDGTGHADPNQRLSPAEIATLLGLDVPTEAGDQAGPESGREDLFWVQLRAHRSTDVADAVRNLLDGWKARGQLIAWGTAAEVSAALVVNDVSGRRPWPWVVYPVGGTVEVVFQHLAIRPPFDDTGVREELRQQINRIPGVALPASKLELRPSFPLDRLVGEEAQQAVSQVHDWFLARVPEPAPADKVQFSWRVTS